MFCLLVSLGILQFILTNKTNQPLLACFQGVLKCAEYSSSAKSFAVCGKTALRNIIPPGFTLSLSTSS
jgi:hypothetical protein